MKLPNTYMIRPLTTRVVASRKNGDTTRQKASNEGVKFDCKSFLVILVRH